MASLLKPLTAIATAVAAATAVESTLNDLITNLVTNIEFFLIEAIGVLVASVFISWLIADLVALFLASTAIDIIGSSPWFSLVLNALIDAINPLFTMFPVLGQLVSAVTPLVQSFVTFLFLPVLGLLALELLAESPI